MMIGSQIMANKRLERDLLPRRFFCALNSTKKSPLQQAPQPKR